MNVPLCMWVARPSAAAKVFPVKHFEDCWLPLAACCSCDVLGRAKSLFNIWATVRAYIISWPLQRGKRCKMGGEEGVGWRCRPSGECRTPGVGVECTAIMNTARSLTLKNWLKGDGARVPSSWLRLRSSIKQGAKRGDIVWCWWWYICCRKLCPLLLSLLNKINNLLSFIVSSKFLFIAFDWNLPDLFFFASIVRPPCSKATHIFP